MIRTTRNPMLGSESFWTQDLSILGFKTKTLSQLVSDMFKNGEQGFFYDPNGLTYGTYGVDQTSIGVPVTVGVADAAEYDSSLHTGHVYRADQYNQSIVNFDVDNTKSHELVIENTGATTIAVNADLAMGTVLFTVAAGQRVTRLIAPVQVIVITSANNVSTATFKIHSLREISGGMYTMYQDAAGTMPVTAAGQPVGLVLDKSKGLELGSEQVTDSATFTLVGAASKIIGNKLVAGKTYKLTFTVSGYSGTGDVGIDGTIFAASSSTRASGNGVISGYALCISGTNNLNFFTRSTNQATFSNISVKELAGNRAYQTTSAQRPLLVANPQQLDYDTVDDKLITNLPTQLTGCTVIRAVPNVGTHILTNQTIPTPYNDSTDYCGLIVINRALTVTETSQITKLFNKAAGV